MSCSYTDYFDLIVFAGDHNVCPSNSAAQNDTGIANALAAANTPVDGKTAILLPPGLLWFSETITINKGRVSLIGMGKGITTLSFQPSTDTVAIELDSNTSDGLDGNILADFTLNAYLTGNENQRTTIANTGILIKAGTNPMPSSITIENVKIQSFRNESDPSADKVGLRIEQLISSRFAGVEFFANNTGCKIEDQVTSPGYNLTTTLAFDSCQFSANSYYGIWIGDLVRGLSFEGSCVMESNGGPGIFVRAKELLYALRFYNVWVEGNQNTDLPGSDAPTTYPYGVHFETDAGAVIKGLEFTGMVKGNGYANDGGGIYAENVAGIINTTFRTTPGTNKAALKIGTPSNNLNIFGCWNESTAPIDPDDNAQTLVDFPFTYQNGSDGTFMIDKQISNSISLTTQTESGSDNQALFLASHKGGLTSSRGAYISLYGNNFTGQTGNLALTAGSSGVIRVNSPAEFNGTGTLNKIDFGSDTVTTDANGVVEVPHGLGVVPTYGMITPGDNADPYIINIVSFDSANMEIKVFETSGGPYQGTLDLYYEVRN